MIVGYARISSGANSNLDSQISRLEEAGVEKIFSEVKSGKSADDRKALHEALEFLREGDCLVVTSVCRIARNLTHLLKILEQIERKGATFRSINQPIDTSTPIGKMMLQALGMAYELERSFIEERIRIGVSRARSNGVKFGRKSKTSDAKTEEMKTLYKNGAKVKDIAKQFDVSIPSVYRYIRS